MGGMGMFNTKSCVEKKFTNFNDLFRYTEKEKETHELLPIAKLSGDKPIEVSEDKYLKIGEFRFEMTEQAFRSFCRILDLPELIIQKVSRKALSTDIINDLIKNNDKLQKFRNYKIVYNSEYQFIVGFVSDAYVPYSNISAIRDLNLENLLKNEFELQQATFINTRMFVQLLSRTMTYENHSFPDRSVRDVVRLGLLLQNSMAGNTAVRFDFFSYRLVCSNGLIVQNSSNRASVYHTGRLDTFAARINKRLVSNANHLEDLIELMDKLIILPFDQSKFAKAKGLEEIERLKLLPLLPFGQQRNAEQIEFAISKLINKQAGRWNVFNSPFRDKATMWDFINIFTAEANKQRSLGAQIEMQKNSGKLAKWIIDNGDKFM